MIKVVDLLRLKINQLEGVQRGNDDSLDKISNFYKLEIMDENCFLFENRIE